MSATACLIGLLAGCTMVFLLVEFLAWNERRKQRKWRKLIIDSYMHHFRTTGKFKTGLVNDLYPTKEKP